MLYEVLQDASKVSNALRSGVVHDGAAVVDSDIQYIAVLAWPSQAIVGPTGTTPRLPCKPLLNVGLLISV